MEFRGQREPGSKPENKKGKTKTQNDHKETKDHNETNNHKETLIDKEIQNKPQKDAKCKQQQRLTKRLIGF